MQFAADDFTFINAKMKELRAERERRAASKRCKGGCGAEAGGQHKHGCGFTGYVSQGEVE